MKDAEATEILTTRHKEDQRYRGMWTKENAQKQKALDEENFSILLQIVERLGGWPKISQVGIKAAHAAKLIAQHNSSYHLEESKHLYKLAYELWQSEPEEVEGKLLTNWKDALCLMENVPQVYGQYFTGNWDGAYEIYKIEKPEELAQRRAAMGLEPYEEYLRSYIRNNPQSGKSIAESYKKIFGKELDLMR